MVDALNYACTVPVDALHLKFNNNKNNNKKHNVDLRWNQANFHRIDGRRLGPKCVQLTEK